jgi:hypothetical protein
MMVNEPEKTSSGIYRLRPPYIIELGIEMLKVVHQVRIGNR